MSRVFIFNAGAGPATLPEKVLLEAASEMLDWHGTGMGVALVEHMHDFERRHG